MIDRLLMIRVRLAVCFVLLCTIYHMGAVRAQSLTNDLGRSINPMLDNYRGIALGAGMTWIDGKPFYLIHLAPQFEIGRLGFGFDGNFRISPEGQLRKEDWRDWYSYVRWINYISFNHQHDDFYARVGGLVHAEIGHGTIVSDYSNFSSYDDRKVGGAARLDLNLFGAEGLTSDFFRPGLIAARPFARPFQLPGFNTIWLVKDIEIGATMALDFDSDATRLIPNHPPWVKRVPLAYDTTRDSIVYLQDSARLASPLVTYGIDLATYLWRDSVTQGRIYADYIKFAQFNHGFVIGMRAAFNASKDLYIDVTAERSLFKNQFIPNYYNSMYELDRYNFLARPQDYLTKITQLSDTASGNGNGFRFGGKLRLNDIAEFRMNYLHLDNLEGRDLLNLEFILPKFLDEFWISWAYSRQDIDGTSDLFHLDERSLMSAQVSYTLARWLVATCNFRWTFARDDQGKVHSQSFIEPRADLIFRF